MTDRDITPAVRDEMRRAAEANRFDEWPTGDQIAQLRAQERAQLDPEYCGFLFAVARRLDALTAAEARAEQAERERDEAFAASDDAQVSADTWFEEHKISEARLTTAEASLAAERERTREMAAALERVIEIDGRNEASPDIEQARRVLAGYRAGQAGGEGADG